jgi:hypothetical protein
MYPPWVRVGEPIKPHLKQWRGEWWVYYGRPATDALISATCPTFESACSWAKSSREIGPVGRELGTDGKWAYYGPPGLWTGKP